MWKAGAASLFLSALRERLAAGDETALAALFTSLMPVLRRRLRRAFRHAPDAAIADAIDEALVQYALDPSAFDPAHGVPLDRFLYQASWRNVADALDADRRRRAREAVFVERSNAGKLMACDDLEASDMIRSMLDMAACPRERRAMRLWLEGECDYTVCASETRFHKNLLHAFEKSHS